MLIAAGTYEFSWSATSGCLAMFSQSALCISHSVIMEAIEPGTVVLNAQGSSSSPRRVMTISSGTVQLIGLNITGGYTSYVSEMT